MQLVRKIKDIVSYQPLANKRIVYRDVSDDILKLSSDHNITELYGRESEDVVFEYKDKVLISRRKEGQDSLSYDLIEYDVKTFQSRVFMADSFPLFIYGSKLLIKRYGASIGKAAQFDLDTNELVWELNLDFRPICHCEKIIFGTIDRKRSTIITVSKNDGSIIWKYDLHGIGTWQDYDGQEKKTQILKALGVLNDKVYLYLNSSKILILDVETGEKISGLENDKDEMVVDFGFSIELDAENDKLIQLARQDLIEIDLETMKVSQTPVEDMKFLNIENSSRIAYDNNHIYFTDKHHCTLGAFNRSTLKIDWTHKLSQEGISESEQPRYGRELKLKDGRLYVLDNKNTLHIFKRHDQQM